MVENVKHIIVVLSGKGGVGKSTVSTQLALSLKEFGHKVGLLDVDLCGPSIPYLLGLEGRDVHHSSQGWMPVPFDTEQRLTVMSIGFLLKNRNDAVIWRGPKKTALIKQFLTDVNWGAIDYLIIDTPPGTSDEHITVMESLRSEIRCDGAVIVTTPQEVAIDDVRREITFCKKTNIPIIGVIENLSGYVCPTCTTCTNIFSSEGGKLLAELAQVPFLGKIPIDSRLGDLTGDAFVKTSPDSPIVTQLNEIVNKIIGFNKQ